ncbi:hypothetical protein [Actinomadura sp. K4S16]|uniref:hypothetical protein n=1 Tax=Actinomadura sp. K4S16 TaxID=1316147 RepID=UPI0011ECD21F|nr:hypothetical protein [Actinomadura sp. K4S16]
MDSLRAAGWKFPERPDVSDDGKGQTGESSSTDLASEKPKTPADPSAETGAKTKEEPETSEPEGSSQPPEEHDRSKTDPAQSGGAEAENSGQAKPEDPRQDESEREDGDRGSGVGQPETGEVGGQDDRDEGPRPQNNTGPAVVGSSDDKTDGDDSEDIDPPTPQSSEQWPGPRVETTDDPEPIQRTPPADASQPPAQPHSRLQSLALARAEQLAAAERNRAVFQDTPAEPGDTSQAIPSQTDIGQPSEEGKKTETSPVEQQGAQAASENGETTTESSNRDASRPELGGDGWVEGTPPAEAIDEVPDEVIGRNGQPLADAASDTSSQATTALSSDDTGNVKPLDVGTYADLKKREKVGDNLEHDHIPSSAALKKSKEKDLGRKLTPQEAKAVHDQGTAIEVPKNVHAKGDTWRGKNTQEKIEVDAADLSTAAERDYTTTRKNLIDEGYSPEAVDAAIKKMREANRKKGI